MAQRDYKPKPAPRKKAPRRAAAVGEARPGSWLSFLSGLGIGLLVAFGVYLWSDALPPPAQVFDRGDSALPAGTAAPPPGAPVLPRPTFDFYKILPEMEVAVPEWELDDDDSDREDTDDGGLAPGTYVLQVGSFKRFEDADRAKARLALLGISATIQRVVINGQDVWFRVHVGPLSDSADIRAMRLRLIENDTDFLLLKIGENG